MVFDLHRHEVERNRKLAALLFRVPRENETVLPGPGLIDPGFQPNGGIDTHV